MFVNIKKNNSFYSLNKKFNTNYINWVYIIIINKLQL